MTDQEPLVSVVMAVRHGRQDIADAVRAVLGQTWSRLELVVVDDASNDGTAAAARRGARDDSRCVVLGLDEQVGATRARFEGLHRATGDYVWFVDSDDSWADTLVETLVAAAIQDSADVVACRARRVELNGRSWVMEGVDERRRLQQDQLGDAILDGLIRGYLWNKLFRRGVLVAPNRVPLSSQDDFLIVLDSLERSDSVTLLPQVLYTYRESSGSVSTDDVAQLDNTARCYREAVGRLPAWPGASAQSRAWDRFALWFWILPTLTTPAHRGWDAPTCEPWTAPARQALTWRLLLRAAHSPPRTVVHALSLKVLDRRFSAVYRAVGRRLGLAVG